MWSFIMVMCLMGLFIVLNSMFISFYLYDPVLILYPMSLNTPSSKPTSEMKW